VVVTGSVVCSAGDGWVGGVRPVVANVAQQSPSPGSAGARSLDAPAQVEIHADVLLVQVGQLGVELPDLARQDGLGGEGGGTLLGSFQQALGPSPEERLPHSL